MPYRADCPLNGLRDRSDCSGTASRKGRCRRSCCSCSSRPAPALKPLELRRCGLGSNARAPGSRLEEAGLHLRLRDILAELMTDGPVVRKGLCDLPVDL